MNLIRIHRNDCPVWQVGLKNNRTGKKITLEVTAPTNDEATRQCRKLFGYDSDYTWTGTDPLYEERSN